jgi:hypothetical protein
VFWTVSTNETRAEAVIAVINSSEDTIEMVREWLHQSGFENVVSAHVQDIRDGTMDFPAFVERHQPQVFIYDISIPYDQNWRFLQASDDH